MSGTIALAQFGFAPALASALVHALWQNALIGVAAALTLRAMARSSAARRHDAAMAFLLAMLLVPLFQFLSYWGRPGAQMSEGLVPAMTAPQLSGAANVFVQETSAVAPFVVLSWLAGVIVMLVRHVAALRALAAMERGPYQILPPAWIARAEQMRAALGIARPVAVRLSDEVPTPFAARLLRPAIWLPLSLLTRVPSEQLEALLAHELAHIARRDWLWNGLQCVVECLFFYHPAVWWLGRRIREEREHASDDLAVTACGDAIALAEALTGLACERNAAPRLVLSATGGSLMKRITRLLAAPPSRGRWGALAVLGALAASFMVLVSHNGVAGAMPDLSVEASTPGELGPGDYRQITANGIDKQRFYRVSVDAEGRRSEVYREDGAARPIDLDVRRWIAGVTRLAVAPHHPAPNLEAVPEHRTLVAAIVRHPAVVAKLGAGAAPTARQIDGIIRIEGARGEADISIELNGPRGRGVAAVEGEMNDRVWRLQSVTVR